MKKSKLAFMAPVLLIGVALFLAISKHRKEGGSGRGWMVVLALYCLVVTKQVGFW